MTELIIGGSGSGKSEYAENRALKLFDPAEGGSLIYLATMEKNGSEAERRIEKHRRNRLNKGFNTIESSRDISSISVENEEKSTLLIESLSNLLANELFGDSGENLNAYSLVTESLSSLIKRFKNTVIVSDDVFKDGITYGAETENYLKQLSKVHKKAALLADTVTEITAGCAVCWKNRERP